MGASVTPAQAQAALATAKQVNPAGVAGLSAAVNSKTAICSIPAGSKGGKLISKLLKYISDEGQLRVHKRTVYFAFQGPFQNIVGHDCDIDWPSMYTH